MRYAFAMSPAQLDVISTSLKSHELELRNLGVEYLAIFGSVARGEASETSDVDLLVQLRRPAGYFAYARVEEWISSLLGEKVEVIPRTSLKPSVRSRVERDIHRVL